jgi:hypothetical protein
LLRIHKIGVQLERLMIVFLSQRNNLKTWHKEDSDCPENQNRSSKKTSSKEKYKSKLKKGFLATWEDLDKDSDSDGDEEANLALMATTSDKENSEHEADSDSEDEDEVLAQLSRTELIDSLKDALKLVTKKAGECKVLKKAYNNLTEKANIIVEENESLKSRNTFLETHYVYDDKVPPEHEFALQELLINGMQRSKIASLIYHVSRNRGEGLGFSRFKDNPLFSKPSNIDKTKPKAIFVKSQSEVKSVSDSEETSKSEVKKSEVLNVKISEPKTSKPQTNVRSKETLIHTRAKSKSYPKPKTFSKRLDKSRTSERSFKQRSPKAIKTNSKGPIKVWVPKSEIVFASDLHSKKAKAAVLVPGQ